MKYIVFFLTFFFGVPLLTWAAMTRPYARAILVGALFVTCALVKQTSINFLSMETYRGPDRGFEMTLTDLIALALCVAVIARYPYRVVWLPFGSLWLGALFLVACLSAASASDPLLSAFSLWKWARAYGIYWCMVNVLRVPWPRRSLWIGMVTTAILLTLYALKNKYLDGIYRVPGTFDHSNTLPVFINLFLPALAIWGLGDRRLCCCQSSLTLLSCLGLCAASQATFSRLGAALSVASFVGALIVANIARPSRRLCVTTVLALLAVASGIAFAWPSIQERLRTAPPESEMARAEFSRAARAMWESRTFGVGPNQFSLALTNDSRYNQFISVMEDEEQAGVCHHIYHLTAAELGQAGLALFVLVLTLFAWRTLLGAIRGKKSLTGLVLWGLLIGSISLHISGLAEWVFRITPVTYLYALCVGLAVGLTAEQEEGLDA